MVKQTPENLCITKAAEVLGDKWTPYIVLALAKDSCGFCKLQNEAGGINPRTLSLRLVKLEQLGIVEKNESGSGYGLTKSGELLVPVLIAMNDWGQQYEKLTTKNKKSQK